MRWKVPSPNTGADDSARAAAERDSGVLAGLTAACGGFAVAGGLAATAGVGGVPKPSPSADPTPSATMTPAIEMVRINPPPQFPLPYWYGGISTGCRSEFCRLGDSIGSKSFHHLHKTEYIGLMTKLLDQALEAVRDLPPDVQDDIARIVLKLGGGGDVVAFPLSD